MRPAVAQAKQTKLAPQMQPRSIRDVTRFLAQGGVEGVSLERGRGFFCFVGVPVHNWLNRTVVTPDLEAAPSNSGWKNTGRWRNRTRAQTPLRQSSGGKRRGGSC